MLSKPSLSPEHRPYHRLCPPFFSCFWSNVTLDIKSCPLWTRNSLRLYQTFGSSHKTLRGSTCTPHSPQREKDHSSVLGGYLEIIKSKKQLHEMLVQKASIQTFSHSRAFKSWWRNVLLVCSDSGKAGVRTKCSSQNWDSVTWTWPKVSCTWERKLFPQAPRPPIPGGCWAGCICCPFIKPFCVVMSN